MFNTLVYTSSHPDVYTLMVCEINPPKITKSICKDQSICMVTVSPQADGHHLPQKNLNIVLFLETELTKTFFLTILPKRFAWDQR